MLDDEGEHPPISAVHDIEELSERARKGEVLEPHDLVAVGHTLGALSRLQRWVTDRAERAPTLSALIVFIDVEWE